MVNFFRRTYRETETPKRKLFTILAFGSFIFLFLFLFKPFGLFQLEPAKQLFITLGFGIITAFVLIVFKFLIEPVIIMENWTIGKNIIWDIVIASSIGAANYIYICIIFNVGFNLLYLLYSIWTAILVGSIPVTVSYFVAYNRMYKRVIEEAAIGENIISWEDEVVITAGYSRNDFRVNPRHIAYLCSNDNYVTIATIRDNVQNKTTIRGTLKSAEKELSKNSHFIRCHKCYIVNLDFVEKVSGNNQNMKIHLSHAGIEIPVARSRADIISVRTAKKNH